MKNRQQKNNTKKLPSLLMSKANRAMTLRIHTMLAVIAMKVVTHRVAIVAVTVIVTLTKIIIV